MNTSSEAPMASNILDMTAVLTTVKKNEQVGFIHTTMDDGKRYKIRGTEEMTKRLQRKIELAKSIRKLQDDLTLMEGVNGGTFSKLERIKASVAAEEAKIEEARKELKAREKGLVAAEREAKKRGKTVSSGTVNAVRAAREHLTILEEDDKFGSLKYLLVCLDIAEKDYAANQSVINNIKGQIACMNAETASIVAEMKAFVTEYVRTHPPKEYVFDL